MLCRLLLFFRSACLVHDILCKIMPDSFMKDLYLALEGLDVGSSSRGSSPYDRQLAGSETDPGYLSLKPRTRRRRPRASPGYAAPSGSSAPYSRCFPCTNPFLSKAKVLLQRENGCDRGVDWLFVGQHAVLRVYHTVRLTRATASVVCLHHAISFSTVELR